MPETSNNVHQVRTEKKYLMKSLTTFLRYMSKVIILIVLGNILFSIKFRFWMLVELKKDLDFKVHEIFSKYKFRMKIYYPD